MGSTRTATALLTAIVAVTATMGLAACKTGGTSAKAEEGPSAAAKIACSAEAVDDISEALGEKLSERVIAVWAKPVYSCDYKFPGGTITLSVTDTASADAATAQMAAHRPADAVDVPALGEEAYAQSDGTTYVRKDEQILRVDVSALPATFGNPPHPRNIDAITVATTVMACWTDEDQSEVQ